MNSLLLKKWPFLNDFEKVPGFFSINESIVMYETIKRITRTCIAIEIGSLLGKSACVIAKSFYKQGSKLYCIDPFLDRASSRMPEKLKTRNSIITGDRQLEMFKKNLISQGVINKISIIREFSEKAISLVPDKVDFIFIDGSHKYKNVLSDYINYEKKLKVGGYMAIHDVYLTAKLKDSGPCRVVQDKMMNSPEYQNPKWVSQILADCLFIAQKVK